MSYNLVNHVKSVSDKLLNFIGIECPDIKLNCLYMSKHGKSVYLSLEYDDKIFAVRISNHIGKENGTYQHEVIVERDVNVKYCSEVMLIIYKIKGGC